MKTRTASKRNPLLPLSFFFVCGLLLLFTGPRSLIKATALPDGLPSFSIGVDTPSAEWFDADEEGSAPEAHQYGYELLERGQWGDAELILRDACETGDLTACFVMAEEYTKRGRVDEAEKGFWLSCRGGQMPACRSLVDQDHFTSERRALAVEQLTEECRDNENAVACTLLADSIWARDDEKRSRRFLGLACSRGDERSCSRLKGS